MSLHEYSIEMTGQSEETFAHSLRGLTEAEYDRHHSGVAVKLELSRGETYVDRPRHFSNAHFDKCA